MSGSVPGERSAAFCRVRCLLSYPKEFYVLFLRFRAAFGAMLRTGCRGGGFAAPRSGAGAVVVGGRTGGPALRFPARGFSLYRPSNVKNQVRAFFAIRRRTGVIISTRNPCDRLCGSGRARCPDNGGCKRSPFLSVPPLFRLSALRSCPACIQTVSGSRQSPQRRISSTSASSARSCGMLRSMISLPLYSVMRPGPDPT